MPSGGCREPPDLHFLVELRGFEPLTPSMRTKGSGVQMDGVLYHLVIDGDGRFHAVREAPTDLGICRPRSCDGIGGSSVVVQAGPLAYTGRPSN